MKSGNKVASASIDDDDSEIILWTSKTVKSVCVVGQLYSVQYKSIFGVPDKVRRNRCEEARPSRLDIQRDKVKIHHIIASTQDCWSWCRIEHSYVGVQYWTDQTRKMR